MPHYLAKTRVVVPELGYEPFQGGDLGLGVLVPELERATWVGVVPPIDVLRGYDCTCSYAPELAVSASKQRPEVVQLDADGVFVEASETGPSAFARVPGYCVERYELTQAPVTPDDHVRARLALLRA